MTDPACFCQKITPLQTIRSAVGPTKLQDWRIAVISHPSKCLMPASRHRCGRGSVEAAVPNADPWNELGSMHLQRKSSR